MDDEPLITTGEVARRLGVTTSAVTAWARKGTITPAVVTPGGRRRWRWSEVQHQMQEWRQREDEQRRQREDERQRDEQRPDE